MIGLRSMPRWLVDPATLWLLRILRIAIGPENPIQDAAISRLNRALQDWRASFCFKFDNCGFGCKVRTL